MPTNQRIESNPTTNVPCGSWPSRLDARQIAEGGIGLIDLAVDGDDVYWLEARPNEGGRCVLVRRGADGTPEDLTPPPFSVRSRVHEYGGRSFLVEDGCIWFANDADQRVYRQAPGQPPQPITPADRLRYAGFVRDRRRGRLICVREDHRGVGEAINTLVALDEDGLGEGTLLWHGSDFVDSPSLSLDGQQLAWIAWNHPDMPWDETRLWLASLSDEGLVVDNRCVNPDQAESTLDPRWAPDGRLYCICDRGGWWNLHRVDHGDLQPVLTMAAEFADAPWQVGQVQYQLLSAQQALVSWHEDGRCQLGRLQLDRGELQRLDLSWQGLAALAAGPQHAHFLAASATAPTCVAQLDLATGVDQVLYRPPGPSLGEAEIARAQAFSFTTGDGETAYAYHYPPRNSRCGIPANERPPAIIVIHGGPTAQASTAYRPALQFWTQRGFAVIDVDYRGSSGHGRDYRHRLRGQWGIFDVEDAVQAATHAVEQGWVDAQRVIIRGGSAGGYTVLAALARHDRFAAGANYYGVSDVEALASDTHKFEARYLDRLIGPYPQERERYRERSPIHHLEGFRAPLIVFQGLEDKVVPPSQSQTIVDALKQRGVPVAYLAFEGEQHGFRRSETQVRALEAELYFYGRVFGFTPADTIEPVPIHNLDIAPSE